MIACFCGCKGIQDSLGLMLNFLEGIFRAQI